MIWRAPQFFWASRRLTLATLAISFLVLIAMNSLSYLVFVTLALIPAMVAAFLERRSERAATSAIASMTMATVLPLVFGAINSQGRDLLTNTSAWSFVIAAVLSGLAVFLVLPAATVWLDDRRAEARIRKLRQKQEVLERDWGPEVQTKIDR